MKHLPTALALASLVLGSPGVGRAHHFFESTNGGCRWAIPGAVAFLSDASSTADIGDTLLADGINARAAWNDIDSAKDVFGAFTKDADDYTDVNFGTAWGIGTNSGASDGQNEIVLDETGDIMRNVFGLDPAEVNGFGPSRRVVADGGCLITDAFNLLNGTRVDFDRLSTFVHEFGHIQGLAHSSVGMYNSSNTTAFSGGFASPAPALDAIDIASVPTMHPFSSGTGSNRRTPEQDDAAGLSELYPEGAFTTSFGGIEGTVRRCFDDSALEGVNVRAVNTADPTLQVSRYTSFDGNGDGRYVISGLPPGEYRVVVEAMGANGFTAGRMAIQTGTDDGFASEYYGPSSDEEQQCTEATPDVPLAVSVAAGATTIGVDVKVGGAELAFVVDDTGSMEAEISAVRDILNAFVDALEALTEDFPTTAIVSFKDDVTLRRISNDPNVLRGVIDGLYASEGGDCPESSNAALLAAGRLLQRDGVAVLFTDADSRDDGPTSEAVAELFRSRSLALSVLLSATCDEEFFSAGFSPFGAGFGKCPQDDGRPGCAERIDRAHRLQTAAGAGTCAAGKGAGFADEFAEPDVLGFQSAFETFSAISAATGGTFLATPRPVYGEDLTAYVNAGTNISISSVVAATALVNPGKGPRGATMNVEITGANTNWSGASAIAIGGGVVVNRHFVHSPSFMSANITVPEGATPGFYDVTATTELGDGATETAVGIGAFQVNDPTGYPEITSVVPSRGAPGTSIEVTITGFGTTFDAATAVSFLRFYSPDDALAVSGIIADSPTLLRATVTVADNAEIAVRDVRVESGDQPLQLNRGFSVIPAAPAIAELVSVSPSDVTRGASGVTLSVAGANTNFAAGATVASFSGSGVIVRSTNVTSATQATVTVDVAPDAALGFRDAFMTTGDETATGLDLLRVAAPCAVGPRSDCRTAGRNLVRLIRGKTSAKNTVKWIWNKGQKTTLEDYGDPTGTTGYTFCLYDSVTGTPHLLMRAEVLAGANWTPLKKGKGFKYADGSGRHGGVRRITLKVGADKKAGITVQGKGELLALPTLPLADDPSVTAQIVAAGTCWGTTVGPPAKNTTGVFKDTK